MHPGGVRGVGDHEVPRLTEPVGDEVVDDSAAVVQHHVVLSGPDGDLREIVGQDALQERQRTSTFYDHFPEVGEIEETDALPHGAVLGQRALVFDGHEPPCERAQARSEGPMLRLERCVSDLSCRDAHGILSPR